MTDVHQSDELPITASDLCSAPCGDDATCFCSFRMSLVDEGVKTIREVYPGMSIQQAAFIIGEMVAGDAALVAKTYEGRFDVCTIVAARSLSILYRNHVNKYLQSTASILEIICWGFTYFNDWFAISATCGYKAKASRLRGGPPSVSR
jgi:hypothetical protein